MNKKYSSTVWLEIANQEPAIVETTISTINHKKQNQKIHIPNNLWSIPSWIWTQLSVSPWPSTIPSPRNNLYLMCQLEEPLSQPTIREESTSANHQVANLWHSISKAMKTTVNIAKNWKISLISSSKSISPTTSMSIWSWTNPRKQLAWPNTKYTLEKATILSSSKV